MNKVFWLIWVVVMLVFDLGQVILSVKKVLNGHRWYFYIMKEPEHPTYYRLPQDREFANYRLYTDQSFYWNPWQARAQARKYIRKNNLSILDNSIMVTCEEPYL